MSRLAEIAKEIGKFETGARELPGFKRTNSSLSNLFKRDIENPTIQDQTDWYNFMLRHYITANEAIFTVPYAAQLLQNNSTADNLEAALGISTIVGLSEAGKYFADRLMRNIDRIYQSRIFQKYGVPVLKPVVETESRLLAPIAKYLDRKSAESKK